MVDLNNSFVEGISDLDCDENMAKFLKKILNYELSLNKDKNNTQSTILENYRSVIENFSEGD